MKWLMEPVAVALAVIAVLAGAILFGGLYLKFTQPAPTPAPAPTDTVMITEIPTTIPITLPETTPPTPEATATPAVPTTPQGNYVVVAKPFHDKKYYMLPYRSTVYDPRAKTLPVIFQQSYRFDFQDEAVVAYIVSPPLVIDYTLTRSVSPTRSFLYLTIRNNATQELLAQDGFYGPFSENSNKRYFFSSPGAYHINMYGGFISVDLTIRAPS